VLLVAIAAVHGPGAIGLEGNLTCLSALCAGGIVHFSWAAVVAASAAASISFHLNSLTFGHRFHESILLQNIPSNSIDFDDYAAFLIRTKLPYISVGQSKEQDQKGIKSMEKRYQEK
jgi:hypothetical protein